VERERLMWTMIGVVAGANMGRFVEGFWSWRAVSVREDSPMSDGFRLESGE
jgi:hypothetical protein